MLRHPSQAPPAFVGTPTSILNDAKNLIQRLRQAQDQAAKGVQPNEATFSNVLKPLIYIENSFTLEATILGFYKDVSADPKLRDASSEAKKLLDEFAPDISTGEALYRLVDAILQKGEDLDTESSLFLERIHKDYIRDGLKLPTGPKRNRVREIKKSLTKLTNEFKKNQVEENEGVWFSSEELVGVPADLLTGLEKGTGENNGMLRVTFKYPDLIITLRYAKNSETRKRYYIANENKCNRNAPMFKEVMVLRDELARLLGYPNHATMRLEGKMAKKPEVVNKFLGDLRSRLVAGAQIEITKLKQLKKRDLESRGETFDGHYFFWDHGFYNRLMLEEQYSVNQQKIAEYFPLQTTIRGMLEIFQKLFGLAFVEIVGDERNKAAESGRGSDIVWHEDVQVFSVWDDEEEGGEFVGYLYMDLFPRKGKNGNPSNFNLQPGFIQEDGTRRYPATALVCSFTKPTLKKPSLLRHDEVVLLFHELGHGIHDLVSRTKYSRFHGTNTVDDFGEAPSQMLENWFWTTSQVKSLSRHYSSLSPEYLNAWEEDTGEKSKPPEQIPDEMIESLIKAKLVNGALFQLRQLQLAIFDMTVHEHENHEAIENLNIPAKYNTLLRELWQIEGPETLGQGYEWGHGEANFGHLMGFYDAGYYGYLSSKVYSADMFYTVFKSDPMNPKEGRRYRHTVLEKGGSQDEMKTLTEFLGREPRTEAFYEDLGLA